MTASELIGVSLRIAGVVIEAGRGGSTSQKNEGLITLNSMLGTWRLQNLFAYKIDTNVHTLTPNLNPHTIGTGGNLNQVRPVRIEAMWLRYLGNPSQPVDSNQLIQLTAQQYGGIAVKTVPSPIPQQFYYDYGDDAATNPKGKVYFWPIPSAANQVVIHSVNRIEDLATLATVLIFPDGYQRAMEYNLAVEFAGRFQKRDTRGDAVMVSQATESMYYLKAQNASSRPLDMKSDPAATYAQGLWDWRSSDWRR